ncbi:MAG: hypothetical protein ACT4OO_01350 [Nitrospiraceae bacterium]
MQRLLLICCSCDKVKGDRQLTGQDVWIDLSYYLQKTQTPAEQLWLTDSFCPDCSSKYQMK